MTPNASIANKAYIITGPTSGFGRTTAFELAKHGTVVLVGRDPAKLQALQKELEANGGRATSVQCDLSDMDSVKRAAEQIVALRLPLAGLINNAGIFPTKAANADAKPALSAQGWDMSYATNHLGPFVLTEALIPHLPDGASVLFVASAVEDPNRGLAKMAGFRGGRYLSAEASARGEWKPEGSPAAGFDAYATTKQCTLAAALQLSKENPRLRINAVEPGFAPGTNLGRDANAFVQFLSKTLLNALAPYIKLWSTPKLTARNLTQLILNTSGKTGVYFDERGQPMASMSAEVRDPAFLERVVNETRAFLAAGSAQRTQAASPQR